MSDFLPILGYDHLEFYVGNARQAAHFYDKVFGFRPVGRSGLETGVRDQASYVLEQGKIRLVFSSALVPDHEIARHCAMHGDGVKAIGLRVPDVEQAVAAVKQRGATVVQPATCREDSHGTLRVAAIKIYGDTIIRFVDRRDYTGVFAPGYMPLDGTHTSPIGVAAIDHIVGNVERRMMDHWARFYTEVMGFSQLCHFTDEDISTEYSALMSKVLNDDSGKIKFPINEPAEGKKKSQIAEYLDFYRGPGVQHVALSTTDIRKTVRELRGRDIEFLCVPDAYYQSLRDRVGDVGEDMESLQELGILVDRDEDGYLLQIFTQPVQDRPTLFFEIIERHGSRGFGIGNFKALFVSIEEEQARRGNL
jgi:4-hydroxyphenylpyruvate dioxygenase